MASDINHVILIGRLTRDAELRYSGGGMAILKFAIAVNRRKKNGEQWEDEVSYFDITLFGKSAESLKDYLVKGKQIAVDGELRQSRWEQDGQSRSKVEIIANNVELLGSGGGAGGGSGGGGGTPRPQTSRPPANRPAPPEGEDSFGPGADDFEDDIPF
ncbi:MAG: single-stranded DNA-binding protein [Spirochaetales bacterium]|jgi:single-strand DNA-binding protein|nr:single-stranded DNA-binding protein [Spirochaetales bacterium]